MRTIGSFEAKTHLAALLEKVARGESFLITRRGKPVASLSPAVPGRKQGPKDLIMEFRRKHAKSLKQFTVEELRKLRDLGKR